MKNPEDLRSLCDVLRWLLPLIAVFALIGQAVTAYAASGTIGEASCCCPVKAKCSCHDHGDESDQATLKRCSGEAKLVKPVVTAAVPTIEPCIACETIVTIAPTPAPALLFDDVSREPEKPPF